MTCQKKSFSKWMDELICAWNQQNGIIVAENISLFKTYVDEDSDDFTINNIIDDNTLTQIAQFIEDKTIHQKNMIHQYVTTSIPYYNINNDNNTNESNEELSFYTVITNLFITNLCSRKCLKLVLSHKNNKYIEKLFQLLFKYHLANLNEFSKLLKSLDKSEWLYPMLKILLSELQRISLASDQCGSKNNDFRVEHPASQKYIESLTDLYRLTLSDTRYGGSGSKLFAMLPTVTMLLKLYFRTSNIQLCGPVITSVSRSPFKDHFNHSDLNTFNFFAGKKAMFSGDISSAANLLKEAFFTCPTDNNIKKRLILIYLIPIQMLLGLLPKTSILEKYSLDSFGPLSQSVRTGNLKLYHSSMEKYKNFFVKHGIYVVLLKVEFLVFRSLLKHMFTITESYNVSIDDVHSIYNLSYGKTISKARFESLLSSLIYNGYIQGTILSEHQRLMVSKSKPFPQLSV